MVRAYKSSKGKNMNGLGVTGIQSPMLKPTSASQIFHNTKA